jgi:hypothetical protein
MRCTSHSCTIDQKLCSVFGWGPCGSRPNIIPPGKSKQRRSFSADNYLLMNRTTEKCGQKLVSGFSPDLILFNFWKSSGLDRTFCLFINFLSSIYFLNTDMYPLDSVADPWNVTFKTSTKFVFLITFWRYIYIIFQSWKVIQKSQNSRNQCFSHYFCLMIERSGSGSLTHGSGSGKPKNIWITLLLAKGV